ncbi:UNVERIFIED_CONTAM: hypothetical protein B566_EDAN018023, partial [Ephemera danica]
MGPAQVQPRGFRFVQQADTYVKTYLKDGERWLQKRKTRVFRMSYEPQYKQTLRYSACDVLGRGLLIMLWAKQKGFESNQGLGGAELALDKLQLTQPTVAWYPIFPMNTLAGADESSPDYLRNDVFFIHG